VRAQAGLPVEELGAPMDVLWFRLSRRPTDAADTMGRFDVGRPVILINRGEHWQCGYVIPRGLIGVGIRPEHVRIPATYPSSHAS
jgi:hypothetical protein